VTAALRKGRRERQSGCEADSGLSGHLLTVYKDTRAWRGATAGEAIHQSCGGPSQLHQESPPPLLLLGAKLKTDYLPIQHVAFFLGGGGRMRIILGYVFPLLIFYCLLWSPTKRRKGFRKRFK